MWKVIKKFENKCDVHPACTAMVIGVISGVVAGCVMSILTKFPNSFSISIWIIGIIILVTVVFFFVE